MQRLFRALAGPVVLLVVMGIGGIAYVMTTGLRGQPRPGAVETSLARAVRGLAVPGATKTRANPLPASPEHLAAGREHFTHYCTACHGPDGGGQDTPFGRGLFPKPP